MEKEEGGIVSEVKKMNQKFPREKTAICVCVKGS